MTPFQLEPWEEAIRFEGDAPQPEWETEELHLACVPILSNKWIMFGREKARPQAGNWLAMLFLQTPLTWSKSIYSWVPQKASEVWFSTRKGRLFAWSDKRCVLEEDGNGTWLSEQMRPEMHFKMEFSPDTWNNAPQLWERVQEESRDVASDFNFQLHWQNKTREEKQDVFFAGRTREIEEVATWILIETGAKTENKFLYWTVVVHNSEENEIDCDHNEEQVEGHLRPWSEFFVHDFLPSLSQPAFQKYTALATEECQIFYHFSAQVTSDYSSHERIEARLRLREWLERNAPDEIERLLK